MELRTLVLFSYFYPLNQNLFNMSDYQDTDRFKMFNTPETMSSLAAKYNVSLTTFKKWIKPIQHEIVIEPKNPFKPADLKKIIDFLGEYNVG